MLMRDSEHGSGFSVSTCLPRGDLVDGLPRAASRILAALPGAKPWKGLSPQRKRFHMACRDDKQYFKEVRQGKIERQKLTKFSDDGCRSGRVFQRLLAILSTDFARGAI